MISLVNGYVCHDCSDVALARQGKDPNAKPGEPQDFVQIVGASAEFGGMVRTEQRIIHSFEYPASLHPGPESP